MYYSIGQYKESDLMSDLICDNYQMLLVMSRFGIPLGFGDHTIGYVCAQHKVNTPTFLAIVNMLLDNESQLQNLSAQSLMNYLKNSHDYFLDFRFPSIREKLVGVLDQTNHDVSKLVINYYDQYVAEVRKHMNYEDKIVFPYVDSVIDSNPTNGYNIATFSDKHDDIEQKLTELKNIIIKYYAVQNSNELNSVIFDIFSCAEELASHTKVEDLIFVPLIEQLEQQKIGKR